VHHSGLFLLSFIVSFHCTYFISILYALHPPTCFVILVYDSVPLRTIYQSPRGHVAYVYAHTCREWAFHLNLFTARFGALSSFFSATCPRSIAPHSSVLLTHYSALHNSLFSLLPNSGPFSLNRAIRAFSQSHSSISYEFTAPTPHTKHSSSYSQLQDGGLHTQLHAAQFYQH